MKRGGPGLDKARVRRAFGRAAATYDDGAVLQQEIGKRLLERLDYVRLQPDRVLDAGCGTGVAAAELMARYPRAHMVALDFALPMLQHARRRETRSSPVARFLRRPRLSCLCADLEQLPLAARSVDLVVSNATLQWSSDLALAFAELRRVLRPGGLLTFTTFGPDTLKELRAAWAQVDDDLHVGDFTDMHDIGDLLLSCGFAEPVMDAEWFTLTYEGVETLMRDIKAIGANQVTPPGGRGLTGKGRLAKLREAYEHYRDGDRLPATYEVVYGHAWAPDRPADAPGNAAGDVAIPVSAVQRRRPVREGD